jgi:hypothetical protein
MKDTIADRAAELVAEALHDVSVPIYHRTTLSVEEQTHHRGKPLPYLLVASQLIQEFALRSIVEIGSMRLPLVHALNEFDPACCNDGHSTLHWAETGADVVTIDVDPGCAAVLAPFKRSYPNLTVLTGDGIEFLRRFRGAIDVLYLDAWDVVEGTGYAEQHLLAYEIATPHLSPRCIVQIDDTDILNGGKGRLLIPRLIRDGFDLVTWGRQAILSRG